MENYKNFIVNIKYKLIGFSQPKYTNTHQRATIIIKLWFC